MNAISNNERLSLDREDINSDFDDDMHIEKSHLTSDENKIDGNASSDNAHKASSKDPSRPRRKKARRACHACQRAHLTCGDERPCARCIKRGLQDQCQDGVRKKAKYLHDAPPEALIPPSSGGTFNLSSQKQSAQLSSSTTLPPPATFYHQNSPNSMDLYPQTPNPLQMPHSLSHASSSFNRNPISPPYSSTHPSLSLSTSQGGLSATSQGNAYPFDPADPALFNLDIGNFNFVNQYGALEFGMLGHMTQNDHDVMTPMTQVQNSYNLAFQHPAQMHAASQENPLLFPRDAMMHMDYSAPRQPTGSVPPLETPHNTPVLQNSDRHNLPVSGPSAYIIAARPSSLTSVSPEPEQQLSIEDGSPALFAADPTFGGRQPSLQPVQPLDNKNNSNNHSHNHHHNNHSNQNNKNSNSRSKNSRKRPLSADYIYESVKKPWSYTENFHRLFHYLKRHFNKDNMAKVSQALATVRPALLTFAQRLTDADLVFMEVCVQRTLYEFDHFIGATGTPTLVTRRDGTILAVSEEFCLITGWPKRVLLGRNPNRMVSAASSTSTLNTGNNSGLGTSTQSPEISTMDSKHNGSNATQMASTNSLGGVLIAEIMDQDSVVQFYEDYAKLAFANPMGRGMRRGKLLKYRTPEDIVRLQALGGRTGSRRSSRTTDDRDSTALKEEDGGIASEAALKQLGEPDGIVDCMYSWWIKRDMFEVPLLMIINFLPILPTDYSLGS